MNTVLIYLGIRQTGGATPVLRFQSAYAWMAFIIALIISVVVGKFVF